MSFRDTSTRLSVNVNKIALLRNSRGGSLPDLLQVALDFERFGAQGITVHPRPDERHVRRADVPTLRQRVTTEFNIEGYPSEEFLELVLQTRPHQCTLVPDAAHQLTSDHGWDTLRHAELLQEVTTRLSAANIRVSVFVDPDEAMIQGARHVGAHRVELYTGPYANRFHVDPQAAVAPYRYAAEVAHELGLGVNAGHDLNLWNLAFFKRHVPHLAEVSIGHALVVDCIYYGMPATVQMYLNALR